MLLAQPSHITLTAKRPGTFKALLLLWACLLASATDADTTAQALPDDVVWPSCISGLLSERATVERVTDGDTVVLTDQRRVRLIGINSAELNAQAPKLKKAAQQAADKLKTWLPRGVSVVLYLGDEPHDRHGRVLAHVIRANDGLAVAQLMVKSGLALQSAVAPTTRCTTDFVKHENQAIEANLGLWKIRDLMSISATEFKSDHLGFKLISGTVTSVKKQKRYTQFLLDNNFEVKVRPKLANQLSLQSLIGHKVEVRGWPSHKSKQAFLWLQHAANLSTQDN